MNNWIQRVKAGKEYADRCYDIGKDVLRRLSENRDPTTAVVITARGAGEKGVEIKIRTMTLTTLGEPTQPGEDTPLGPRNVG